MTRAPDFSTRVYRFVVLMLTLYAGLFVLTACSTRERAAPAVSASPVAALASTITPIAPTPEPVTVTPTDTPTPAPVVTAAQLSFMPATYVDELAGFTLDYPIDWSLDPNTQIGVRGGYALLMSPGTTAEAIAEGGAFVGIESYRWDPKRDLNAYIAQRKIAWEASGFGILREDAWQLDDGRAVRAFVLQTPEVPTYTLLTTIGDDYLQINGSGDLALVEEIARTLRPLE